MAILEYICGWIFILSLLNNQGLISIEVYLIHYTMHILAHSNMTI